MGVPGKAPSPPSVPPPAEAPEPSSPPAPPFDAVVDPMPPAVVAGALLAAAELPQPARATSSARPWYPEPRAGCARGGSGCATVDRCAFVMTTVYRDMGCRDKALAGVAISAPSAA